MNLHARMPSYTVQEISDLTGMPTNRARQFFLNYRVPRRPWPSSGSRWERYHLTSFIELIELRHAATSQGGEKQEDIRSAASTAFDLGRITIETEPPERLVPSIISTTAMDILAERRAEMEEWLSTRAPDGLRRVQVLEDRVPGDAQASSIASAGAACSFHLANLFHVAHFQTCLGPFHKDLVDDAVATRRVSSTSAISLNFASAVTLSGQTDDGRRP